MKFLALALTLLLAVGSQSAAVRQETPEFLVQFRQNLNDNIERLKGVVEQIEDPELKANLKTRIEAAHQSIQSLSPYTDTAVNTVMEATRTIQETYGAGFEELKAKVQTQRQQLESVVTSHAQQYQQELLPMFMELYAKLAADVQEFSGKMEQKRAMIIQNAEETKQAMMPLFNTASEALNSGVSAVKDMVAPYIPEYQAQFQEIGKKVGSLTTADMEAARDKIKPHFVAIKTSIDKILQEITEEFTARFLDQ